MWSSPPKRITSFIFRSTTVHGHKEKVSDPSFSWSVKKKLCISLICGAFLVSINTYQLTIFIYHSFFRLHQESVWSVMILVILFPKLSCTRAFLASEYFVHQTIFCTRAFFAPGHFCTRAFLYQSIFGTRAFFWHRGSPITAIASFLRPIPEFQESKHFLPNK